MIIDALKYLIQADTRTAEAGVSNLRKSADDLTESMKKSEDQTKKTGAGIKSMAQGVLGLLGVTLSVSATLNAALSRATEVADMSRLADSIGVAVGEVDALQGAFRRAGASGDQARGLLEKLTESIGKGLQDIKSKEATTFASLGIGLKDAQGKALGADQALLKIAGSLQGMDRAAARVKLMDLGISDPKTIELMLKGRQELDRLIRLQKEQGVVSKESAERARMLDDMLNNLRVSGGNLANGFLDRFIPAVTKVIEWLGKVVDFAAEHQDAVVGFLMAIAGVVAYMYLPAMIKAAAATLAATWPILLIVGAIGLAAAAFALLYDDIMNFIEGNDSMIGEIFQKYPMVEKIVMGLIDVFKQYYDAVIWVFKEAGNAIGAFADDSVKMLTAMGDSVVAIFKWLIEAITGPMKFLNNSLDAVKKGASAAASFLGFGSDEAEAAKTPDAPYGPEVPTVPAALAQANAQLAAAAAAPVNNMTSNAISNSARAGNVETNVAVGTVTVQTQATDAQGIAGSIGSELNNALKSLETENASGVAR